MLIGREPELALVERLVDRDRGVGGGLVLHGDPGIGKSALAQVAARRAQERGATVLTTTGVQAEADLPYSCLHQLIRPVMAHVDDLPDGERAALRSALGGVAERPVDPYRAGLAVLTLLGDVATTEPVTVIAEDAHWLDRPTSEVLAFVARRVQADDIAMLFTSREPVPASIRDAGLETRRLEPLTQPAADALLHALEPALSAETRRSILEQAAGNPLGIVELLSETLRGSSEPALPTWLPLSTRLERAFASRVAELPQDTRTVLLVASLTDRAELAEILAATGEVVGRPLDLDVLSAASAAGLVEVDGLHVRFSHPLVRTAIAQGGTAGTRQAAHAALAHALAEQPDRAIWHRLAAAAGATDDALGDEVAAMAGVAAARGSVVTAATMLARAAALTGDEERRAGRLLDAAELALEVGRGDVVERALTDAAGLRVTPADDARRRWLTNATSVDPPDPAWFDAYLEHGEHLLAAGDVERASQALLTVASRAWWSSPPDALRERIVGLADELPPPAHLVRAIVAALTDPVRSGERVTAELRAVEPNAVPTRLLRVAAVAAAVVGDFDHGAVLADVAITRLRTRGRYGLLAPALAARAWCGVFAGRWSASLASATDGVAVARETGQPLWAVSATAAEATLTALRGSPDDALVLAHRALELLPAGEADGMQALVVLAEGAAHLAAGRDEEAVGRFDALLDPAEPWHTDFVARWAVADAADAAFRSGDLPRLQAVVAWAERAEQPSPHLLACIAYARMLADEGDGEGSCSEALEAASHLPAMRARVQLARGSHLRRLRRPGEARAVLRAARDTFEALGMPGNVERARQELRAAGESVQAGPVDAEALLTAQELQIARMAAEGMTNRDIGAALYLSHRTVGAYLYRIFPKLGISARAELRAVLQ